MRAFAEVEVPRALRKRPKDRRGYPIPYIVFRDTAGKPHFTINDQSKHAHVVAKGLCSLCGGKLKEPQGAPGVWLVGGPICFLSPMGAFLDPGMHEDCARYALSVCPYLAAPRYATRIDEKTLKPEFVPGGVVIDNSDAVSNDRPTVFMLGSCAGYTTVQVGQQTALRSVGEWLSLEVWEHGKPLDAAEAEPKLRLDLKRFA